ncbi:MAG: SIR2 family NAD-dependent protein deacylase, partial [Promethearchaeota archaeon]
MGLKKKREKRKRDQSIVADMSDSLKERLERAASLIRGSKHCVVLTGAGMSTESGIPDFRSPGGLWSQYEPEISANIETFLKDPRQFWKMALKIAPALFKAKPNTGHKVLAKLEDEGYVKAIMTQNIDGLHQKAGNIYVFELHGNIDEMKCVGCGATYSQRMVLDKIKRDKQLPPLCDMCAAPLKPNVV